MAPQKTLARNPRTFSAPILGLNLTTVTQNNDRGKQNPHLFRTYCGLANPPPPRSLQGSLLDPTRAGQAPHQHCVPRTPPVRQFFLSTPRPITLVGPRAPLLPFRRTSSHSLPMHHLHCGGPQRSADSGRADRRDRRAIVPIVRGSSGAASERTPPPIPLLTPCPMDHSTLAPGGGAYRYFRDSHAGTQPRLALAVSRRPMRANCLEPATHLRHTPRLGNGCPLSALAAAAQAERWPST